MSSFRHTNYCMRIGWKTVRKSRTKAARANTLLNTLFLHAKGDDGLYFHAVQRFGRPLGVPHFATDCHCELILNFANLIDNVNRLSYNTDEAEGR